MGGVTGTVGGRSGEGRMRTAGGAHVGGVTGQLGGRGGEGRMRTAGRVICVPKGDIV